MDYKQTNWVNDVTPLNAENMNNIENGIKENENNIKGLSTKYISSQNGVFSTNVSSGKGYMIDMYIVANLLNKDTLNIGSPLLKLDLKGFNDRPTYTKIRLGKEVVDEVPLLHTEDGTTSLNGLNYNLISETGDVVSVGDATSTDIVLEGSSERPKYSNDGHTLQDIALLSDCQGGGGISPKFIVKDWNVNTGWKDFEPKLNKIYLFSFHRGPYDNFNERNLCTFSVIYLDKINIIERDIMLPQFTDVPNDRYYLGFQINYNDKKILLEKIQKYNWTDNTWKRISQSSFSCYIDIIEI